MSQANAVRAETSEGETTRGTRPVATFKQGGVEVSVWKNPTDKGDMYNTTIRNSYKDDKSEWKDTTSFSPADLAVLAQLSGLAFQEIVKLKAQSRSR
jgi:hypothetical protein